MASADIFLFVSHVSEDRDAAMTIVAKLERRGLNCWIAPRDVKPGRPFDDEIANAIESSRAMLLIFSEHCNASEYIRREVTFAGEGRHLARLSDRQGAADPVRRRVRIFARQCLVAVLAVLSIATIAGRAPASAEERVKFASAAPRTQAAQQRDAAASARRKSAIQGYLTIPKGEGPFPAVALLHSCLGLPADRRAIGEAIASWGYVALFVDDFTMRGLKETCTVDFSAGIADAFGALLYLSKLPYVDARRIGAIGYSQGADTALTIASSRLAAAFAIPDDLRFKAAAAFYPPCENQAGARLTIPTEILIGAADEVTPAADCERLAKAQPAGGSDLRLIVYPGAAHLFDDPSVADGKSLLGMRLKYDRSAAEQSRSDLREFLAGKLAR